MAADIAPELLEKIRKEFIENIEKDKMAKELLDKIEAGKGTYEDAGNYAEQIGAALSKAFQNNLSSDILPEGKLYWNIADRVLRPMFEEDYEIVSNVALTVQEHLNKAAGIGIKAQKESLNKDRVDGILNRVSSADKFDDVKWILDEPVKTFSRSVVDDTLKKNVEFQGKAGLTPKVIRRAESKCCKWCRGLAGVYDYPEVPKDVYRRHENCRCIVEYNPGDGKRQNVHTKKWTTPEEYDKIEARKAMKGLELEHTKKNPTNPVTKEIYIKHDIDVSSKQFGAKIGKHAKDYGLNPGNSEDRANMLKIIRGIVDDADERFYGEWRDQEYPVLFHVKGEDVVIENNNGEFVTIMKGGITNARVKNARK